MWKEGDEEPASPSARLMQSPKFNLCIISMMGYNTKIDTKLYKKCVEQTLLKHPRFSSILVSNGGKCSWRRTSVDVDNHVYEVDLDAESESVDSYASDLSKTPMDPTKPLWEIHILNVGTPDAAATALFKIHHSVGDGVSMMALCHACSRSLSDPDALPALPSPKKRKDETKRRRLTGLLVLVWRVFVVLLNTVIDIAMFLATMVFLEDSRTPVKSDGGEDRQSRTRFVHRVVSLDDVKLVKTALNASINDVMLGVTVAGLSHYLNQRYEKGNESGSKIIKNGTNSLPRNLRLRSAVVFNLRQSPTVEDLAEMMEKEELNGMWGNFIGIVILPFTIKMEDDPLAYIRRAKATMDQKKLSLGHKLAFVVMKLTMLLFGIKSLVVHHQSYGKKLIISIGADEKLIPNPHQLCDDLVESLQIIKVAATKLAFSETC
ncbi:wax ester synthase/diacylglycerol acyltransferase 11-like isoform X2 [Salvia hispanica]|uniref:wax ester synthase/diacylglycerol acyltransferase 11-like isoform X2 n=1 Tax=Salvia hispanica TaxID=49212 RepID=UPI00200916D6|nr:wax ester synthase/diacylglycerol acyltransferase 11-like isoform X2 [Salvia hispanica]